MRQAAQLQLASARTDDTLPLEVQLEPSPRYHRHALPQPCWSSSHCAPWFSDSDFCSDGSDVRCSSTGPPSSATPSARAERRAAHTRTRAHTPPRRIRCDQCARDVPGAASRRGGAVVCARQHDRLADRNLAGSCHSLTSSSHPRDMRTSLFTPPVHSQAISTSKSGGAKPRAAGGGANLGRVGGGVKDARGRGGAPQKGDPRRSL